MIATLNEIEARVLGALVEKSLTTPDQYPLSLNSLVAACNQKTSRDPVMELAEAVVGQGLHALIDKHLAGRLHEPGARVPKFMHHVEMLLSDADDKAVAAVCVLLLRGPQTPGELKTRAERLCRFESTAEVESLLQRMAARAEPWVTKLPRQPGQKESRYRHLFSGEAAPPAVSAPAPAALPAADERLSALEARVEALEAEVRRLAAR